MTKATNTQAGIQCPLDSAPGPSGDEELTGCGSYRVIGPDDEGFYDCLDCGLWFARAEAAEEGAQS